MRIVILLMLCVSTLSGNELPDMPAPKVIITKPVIHPFLDRPNKVEIIAIAGLWTFDMGQTCHNLAHGGRENYLTQSCGSNIAITAGVNAGTVGLAWLLHRTGHHKLERLPMLWKAGDSISGIVFSKRHGAF
jgi:hypothetical protein